MILLILLPLIAADMDDADPAASLEVYEEYINSQH